MKWNKINESSDGSTHTIRIIKDGKEMTAEELYIELEFAFHNDGYSYKELRDGTVSIMIDGKKYC